MPSHRIGSPSPPSEERAVDSAAPRPDSFPALPHCARHLQRRRGAAIASAADRYAPAFTRDIAQSFRDLLDWTPSVALSWRGTVEDIIGLPEHA